MFTRPTKILRPPLAVPPRPGPAPRSPSHLPGPWVTRHQRGFTHVRPSGLPLACAPGWNGTRFGFSPELRTPRLPATHVRAGTGLNTGQELRHRHRRPSNPRTHSQHAASCRTSSAQSSPANSTPASPIHHLSEQRQREENTNGLMDKCSRQAAGTTPLQWCCSPHGQQGHGLCQGLDSPPRLRECSLTGRYRIRVCRVADPVAPIRLRAQGWVPKMLSAERLERIFGCPCGWRGRPGQCAAFRPRACDLSPAMGAPAAIMTAR